MKADIAAYSSAVWFSILIVGILIALSQSLAFVLLFIVVKSTIKKA